VPSSDEDVSGDHVMVAILTNLCSSLLICAGCLIYISSSFS
jgi:hypothetical protein